MILQPHDLGQARLFDAMADPDFEGGVGVDGAGIDGIPRLFEQRQLFTGQHGFVEAGLPKQDDAIRRQGGTRQHPYPVADLQRLGGHLVFAILIEPGGHDGHQPRQVGARLGGLASGPQLEEASQQQEEDEHGDGVVIDLAGVEHGGPHGGDEGADQRQRYRHVHGEVSLPEAAPGAHVEGLGRVDHDGGGEQQTYPLEVDHELLFDADEEVHVERHRAHHHLHGAEPRQCQPEHVAAHLFGVECFLLVSLEGVGAIADLGKTLEDVAQREPFRIPLDAGPVGGGVDVDVVQPGQIAQMAFDEPGTGGAGQAFHRQLDLAHLVAAGGAVGDKILLHFGQIIVGEGGELCGYQLALGAGGGAVLVVAGQAALQNGFRHRLTTGAAHGLDYAFYLEGIAAAGGYRLTTVKAAAHDSWPQAARPVGRNSEAPVAAGVSW